MVQTDYANTRFRKFTIILGAGFSVWFSYLTFRWLLSSHPWGAIYPATLAALIGWSNYGVWRPRPKDKPRKLWPFQVAGAGAVAATTTMWIVAIRTGDHVYHQQAVGLSFWGGLFALGPVIVGALWLHPKWRSRMRAARRGEFEEWKAAHKKSD